MRRAGPGVGDAYYLPLPPADDGAERFSPTRWTVGPWSDRMQHMSPPSALLVRALEHCAPRPDARLTRVTVDVLGVVPRSDLTVRAFVARPGRRIELVTAELVAATADGSARVVARAHGWRMAGADTTTVAVARDEALPHTSGGERDIPDVWVPGYVDSVEWRWVSGSLDECGPGQVWARARIDLVAGEEPTALQTLFAVVDSANGVGSPLDVREWTFLNTDLTVHLFRSPVGGWTGLSAETSIGPDGIGTCAAVIHDELGPIGRSAQILLVRPRS